jgi:hypothetical protein
VASFYEISPSASATASFTVADRLVKWPSSLRRYHSARRRKHVQAGFNLFDAWPAGPLARLPPLVHRQAAEQ